MRKTIIFIFGTMLMVGPMIQLATAQERDRREDRRAEDMPAFSQDPNYRATYDQWREPSVRAPLTEEEERNKEDFGFSGRDPSRPGGEDPSLNPSD
jgi:hypothetical protein